MTCFDYTVTFGIYCHMGHIITNKGEPEELAKKAFFKAYPTIDKNVELNIKIDFK